jgi:Ca2+-binding EF-hand superfamily protein
MKQLKLLAALAGVALALASAGKALAQGAGGMDQQQMQNLIQQAQSMRQMFQNMDPQQMQNLRQQFQSLDPQQQMDMMQQFSSMDPQQQQDMLQSFQSMDPQQMQNAMRQRVTNSLREQMGVTNDADWSLIEERINAVTKAQAAVAADGGGMTGLGALRGNFGGGRGGRLQATSGRLSPEAQALQQAVADNAPAAQLKDLVAKLRAAHLAKQEALAKAQEDLRSVLTTRQEAIAVLRGLLD